MKKETTLKLLPLEQPLPEHAIASPDQDNWLNNDNASLVDNLYQQEQQSATVTRVHQCQQLVIRQTEQGFELETEQGTVELQEGDVIALKDLHLLVTLQSQFVEPLGKPELPERQIMPVADDIWQSQESLQPVNHFADPFAQQQMPAPMSLMTPTMPAIPSQPQFGLVEQQDPLNFLYPSHNVAPTAQQYNSHGNILHDLGINEQQTVLVNRQYDTGKPSYLEQSPVDMLDEYLVTDEVQTQISTPALQTSQMENYYAPTIHDEKKQSMFSSMKKIFSRRKANMENIR